MARKSLAVLNEMLFEQLEALSSQELKGSALDDEVKRTDSMVQVAGTLINSSELMYKAAKLREESMDAALKLPSVLIE